MRFNQRQKSYLFALAFFILVCIVYEGGYYLLKGQINFSTTPYIMLGALLVTVIGVRRSRDWDD